MYHYAVNLEKMNTLHFKKICQAVRKVRISTKITIVNLPHFYGVSFVKNISTNITKVKKTMASNLPIFTDIISLISK